MVKTNQPKMNLQRLPLDDLTPVQRAFFIAWALSPEETREPLKAFMPSNWLPDLEPMSAEILKAYLSKMLAFEAQSYFLGIHDSWLKFYLGDLQPAPLLLEALKSKLVRLPYYDDLLETGRFGLGAHLVSLGKRKAAELIAAQSAEVQEALIKAMAEVTEGRAGPEGIEKLLAFAYLGVSELFKNIGLYIKDQGAVQQIAERVPYEDGQKLLGLFKES